MKLSVCALFLGLSLFGCSDNDNDVIKENAMPKNVIGFSAQVTESDNSKVTGRSIIADAGSGTQKLPEKGTLHVFAHKDGETDFYINDILPDWWSTTAPYFNFTSPLKGTGTKSTQTSYVWPNQDNMTFYAYYYMDGGASLVTTDNKITYTLADNVAGQCDLLVADTMRRSSVSVETTGVPMNFRHIMSMVKFSFVKTVETDAEDIRLESIIINDCETGSIDVTEDVAWGEQKITPDTTTKKDRTYTFATPIKAQKSTESAKYLAETASLMFPEDYEKAYKLMTVKYRVYRNATDYDVWETTDTLRTIGTSSNGKFEAGKMYLYTLKYTEKQVILEQKPIVNQWNTYNWADKTTNVVDVWGNVGVEVDVYYILAYSSKDNYSESKVRSATDPFTLQKGGYPTNSAAEKAKYKGKMIIPSSAYSEYNYTTTPAVGRVEFSEIPWGNLTSTYGTDYYKRPLDQNMCPWYRAVKIDGTWYAYGAPFFRYMTVTENGSSYRSWFYSIVCQYYLYRWCEKDEGKSKNNTPTARRDKNADGTYSNYTAAEAVAEKVIDPTTQIKEGTPHRSVNDKVKNYTGNQNVIERANKNGQNEEATVYYNNGNPFITSTVWGEYPTAFKMMNGLRTYMNKNLTGTEDGSHTYLSVDVYRSKFLFVMTDVANDYYNLDVEHIEWYVVNDAGGTGGAHADGIVCSDMSENEWNIISDETE